jgi:hypothetical protein
VKCLAFLAGFLMMVDAWYSLGVCRAFCMVVDM